MVEGAKGLGAHAERDHRRRMVVHHGLHVGTRPVNLAVDEPLEIERASRRVHTHAVEVVLHDVGCGDQLGRQGAGQPVALRIPVVANAHVAVCVHHTLVCQDPVGGHEVVDERHGRRDDRPSPENRQACQPERVLGDLPGT